MLSLAALSNCLQGHSGSGNTADVLVQPATARPLAAAELQKAVGQHLGNDAPLAATSWSFDDCDFSAAGGGGLFVPAAAVKEARRVAVAELLAARQLAAASAAAGIQEGDVLAERLTQIRTAGGRSVGSGTSGDSAAQLPLLRVLCRTNAQVLAALELPWLQEVVLDFLEVRACRPCTWRWLGGGGLEVNHAPDCVSCSLPAEGAWLEGGMRCRPGCWEAPGCGDAPNPQAGRGAAVAVLCSLRRRRAAAAEVRKRWTGCVWGGVRSAAAPLISYVPSVTPCRLFQASCWAASRSSAWGAVRDAPPRRTLAPCSHRCAAPRWSQAAFFTHARMHATP